MTARPLTTVPTLVPPVLTIAVHAPAVGGDSRKYVHLICLPELMHSGSLIIDDIQDRSEMRRGKKCVHHIYGEPLSINAGCACYFLGQGMHGLAEQIVCVAARSHVRPALLGIAWLIAAAADALCIGRDAQPG